MALVEKDGFTACVAGRKELVKARTWTLVMREREVQNLSVEEEVQKLLDSLDQLGADGRVQTRQIMVSMGPVAFKAAVVKKYDLGEEAKTTSFRDALTEALTKAGYFQKIESWGGDRDAAARENSDQNRSRTTGSRTAVSTAMLRAIGHALGFGPDHWAQCFIDRQFLSTVDDMKARMYSRGYLDSVTDETRRLQLEKPYTNHSPLAYMQTRTCFMDDVLRRFCEVVGDRAATAVNLGAGYDTRFYRVPLPANVRAVEVDAPMTQVAKKAALPEELAVRGVTMIPCDFEDETRTFVDVLRDDAHCRLDGPVLFMWEGVIYYCSAQAVHRTLGCFQAMPGPVAVALDYFHQECIDDIGEAFAKAGEPLRFGISTAELATLASAYGFTPIDHVTGLEGLRRYLPTREDGQSIAIAGDCEFFTVLANAQFVKQYCR